MKKKSEIKKKSPKIKVIKKKKAKEIKSGLRIVKEDKIKPLKKSIPITRKNFNSFEDIKREFVSPVLESNLMFRSTNLERGVALEPVKTENSELDKEKSVEYNSNMDTKKYDLSSPSIESNSKLETKYIAGITRLEKNPLQRQEVAFTTSENPQKENNLRKYEIKSPKELDKELIGRNPLEKREVKYEQANH